MLLVYICLVVDQVEVAVEGKQTRVGARSRTLRIDDPPVVVPSPHTVASSPPTVVPSPPTICALHLLPLITNCAFSTY
ncbi:uncharacterized protein G2W53_044532 [Senna tora]|uniref:Secreted protein n=1 Tax=Senna tora TaxID=362788 RepID=A0A834W071_9FABA|nr:uncharacterized protein G2W53_044532 [Senna tora]